MPGKQKHRRDPSDLNNAQYLTLDFLPVSGKAEGLAVKLHKTLTVSRVKAKGRGRPSDDTKVKHAAVVIVAELIDVAKGSTERTVHHGLSPKEFTGKDVSYRHFKTAMNGLEKHKLVTKRLGSWNKQTAFADADNPGIGYGYNTRWHSTQKLIDLCKSCGVTHKNIEQYFEIKLPKQPLVLRQSSSGNWQNRAKGRMVKFPETAHTTRLRDEVIEINEFLKDHSLTGATHRGYRRIYNQGDNLKTYRWDKGGRVYGSGSEESYLTIKKAIRKKLLIDGETTVEIDVRASFLTIFHALHDISVDVEKDPYEIPPLPREIVKLWMMLAFGAGKPPTRWTPKAAQDYRESKLTRKELGEDYNLKTLVTPKILAAFPVLHNLKAGGIDCFDLMNRESNAIVASMLRLLRVDRVPAFSVHDCLIVRERDQKLATRVLQEEYFNATCATPYLKVT